MNVAQQTQRKAETTSGELRETLARGRIAAGWRQVADGNAFAALTPFAEALRWEESDPPRAAVHRMPLASVLNQCPRLVRVWFVGGRLQGAELSAEGTKLVTAIERGTNYGAAQVWDVATGQALTPPMVHADAVTFVQFSPDARRVVTASYDGTARVWDALTGQPISPPLSHENGVAQARFSPDGQRVVTGDLRIAGPHSAQVVNRSVRTHTSTLAVWDAVTGGVIWSNRVEHRPLEHVSFSPDGRLVVAGSHTFVTTFFDAETGERRWAPRCWWLNHAEFSHEGARVLLAGAFGGYAAERGARLFDAKTGKALGPLLAHDAEAFTCRFSPDGRRAATGSQDFTAQVWDAESGARLTLPLRHDADVVSVEFSADGRRLLTGSADRTARVWDAASGQALFPPLPHGDLVRRAVFLPDQERVLIASADGHVFLWELGLGSVAHQTLRHGANVLVARFSPDGKRVASFGADGLVQVWATDTGDLAAPPMRSSPTHARLEFHPDGRRLLSGMSAAIFDIETGQTLHTVGGEFHACFSPDGQSVLTLEPDAIYLWDAANGQMVRRFPRAWTQGDARFGFSPDGRRLVFENGLGVLRIADVATGALVVEFRAHQAAILLASFSPDSKRLVSASKDFTARVWDAATGQPLTPPLTHRAPVTDASFSCDGRQVLTASGDGTAMVWDAFVGKPAVPALRHEAAVVQARFSPDGRLALTASRDGTARVWDAVTGDLALPPLAHSGRVNWAEFSPDGHWILTASDDGAVRLWPVPTDERPAEDWLRLAELFTVEKEAAAQGAWAELRARHPEDFTVSEGDKLAWLEHAAFQAEHDQDWSNAVRCLDRLLVARPDSDLVRSRRSHALFRRSETLTNVAAAGVSTAAPFTIRSNALLDAVNELTRTLDWLSAHGPNFAEERKRLLRDRRAAYQELSRPREAHQDFLLEREIPPRADAADPHLVDLTDFYNAALQDPLVVTPPVSFARLLPCGIKQLDAAGAVPFDVRAMVRLDSPSLEKFKGVFPSAVRGIQLGLKCRRLHFLHAAIAEGVPAGTEAASLIIHLGNGETHPMKLKLGEDLWSFWIDTAKTSPPTKAKVVWSDPTSDTGRLQLYQSTWENPQPDVPVETFDYLSAMNNPAPFLVAVTAEP